MARRKRSVRPSNSLQQLLEAGEPIVGRTGYIRVSPESEDITEQTVFVKVKIMGFKAEGCGLSVKCSIVSGAGELDISPCQWFDSIPEVESYRKKEMAISKARQEYYKIERPIYKNHKIKELQQYIKDNMITAQQEDFALHVTDTTGKSDLEKVAMCDISKLAKAAVCVVNDIQPPDHYDLNIR